MNKIILKDIFSGREREIIKIKTFLRIFLNDKSVNSGDRYILLFYPI